MRLTRALLLIAVAFGGSVAASIDGFVIEDWRSYPLGTRGVPPNWKSQTWGAATYDFTIVADNGRPVLHLKSKRDSSTIARDLRNPFDLRETPVLRRPGLRRLAAFSGDGALADHWLCLGFDGTGGHDLQEPEGVYRHLCRRALGSAGSRQVDHRAPQRRRRFSEDLRTRAGTPERPLAVHRFGRYGLER